MGRNLRNGGGLEYSGSCLGASILRRFPYPWDAVGVPDLIAPEMSVGGGGGVGGGDPGGLDALLPGAARPSPAYVSPSLFPISDRRFSITRRVFLVSVRASRVSLEQSRRSDFLLI